MILSVGHCQIQIGGHYAPHLQGSHFLKHHRTVCLLAIPGTNVLLLSIVSTALQPILNLNKKLLKFAFSLILSVL